MSCLGYVPEKWLCYFTMGFGGVPEGGKHALFCNTT